MQRSKQIVTRKMNKEDIKDFQSFVDKNYKKKHILATNNKVLKWHYKSSVNFNFVLAKVKKKIIGVHGFMPLSKFDKRLKNNQFFLAFWCVAKNKFPGLGITLFKKTIKICKPKFIATIGLNKRVLAFHKWQGFEIKKMSHFIFFSPFIKKFKICNFKYTNKRIKIKTKNLNYIQINSKNIHNLINRKIYIFQNPLKSNYYLINKYLKNPFYKYKLYLIEKDNIQQALVIFRFVKYSNSEAIRIVDFVGKNKNFKLVRHLMVKLLQKSQAEFVDIYSFGIPNQNLKLAGFVDREKIKDLIVPNHYEPFEFKNIDLYCAYKSINLKKNIRLFRGDGDGERPSIVDN